MPPTKEDLSKFTNSKLAEELSSRGLETSGKKADLVDRLWEALNAEGKAEPFVPISDVKSQQLGGQVESVAHTSEVKRQVVMEAELSEGPVRGNQGNPPAADFDASRLLLAKLRRLKEREQLEEQELRIKVRKQQLEIEEQLAAIPGASVRQEELDAVRVTTTGNSDTSSPGSDFVRSHMQRLLLPPTEVESFDGDILKYKLFIRSFEARVASRTTDKDELLHYLEQFTTGKARQIVTSCMYLGQGGYDEARRLLDQRYGSSHRVVDAYIQKLNSWGKIGAGDVDELDRLTLFLTEIKHVMVDLDIAGELEHPRTLREVIEKLPPYLRDRWLRVTDGIMEEERRTVRFRDLVDFLSREVRVKKNPLFGQPSATDGKPARFLKPGRTQCSAATAVKQTVGENCPFCSGSHFLDDCSDMKWRPLQERKAFIQAQRLCFGCLRKGHVAKFCKRRLSCGVCGKRHATLLHQQPGDTTRSGATQSGPANSSPVQVTSGRISTDAGMTRTLMPVVPVRVISPSGGVVVTYAFCDSGSSGTFITQGLADKLGEPCKSTTISVDTVCGSNSEISTSVLEGIRVGPLVGESSFVLPPVFTLNHIPVSSQDKCDLTELRRWPHLSDVDLSTIDSPVEMLIGGNCPQLLVPEEVRRPESDGPCAVRTPLGWYIIGPSSRQSRDSPRHTVNRIKVTTTQGAGVTKGESEHELFCQLYNQDFRDVSEDREGMSVEDRDWLDTIRSKTRKDSAGHYEIGLPLRASSDAGDLPDSLLTAKRRLEPLRRRLANDSDLRDEYVGVVQRLFDEGYAERVPDSEVETQDRTWYLPHHGVRHPEKKKLRVVFDCSAKTGNLCLNDLLVKGPNLTNSLVGVLLRFREGPVAFTCDVDSMFHRVRLPAADSNMLRFLWFRDNDISGEVIVCRMKSHIFGAVSSPSVANFALRQCAEEGRERYPEAAEIVDNNVYVDDALVSTSSVGEAIRLASDLKELCRTGAFNMSKFTSNSADFLKGIPHEDRGKNVKNLDLEVDSLKPERALGMLWTVEDDTFRFTFADRRKPVTRRGILSQVSALFDPLGIVSPVTLQGKVLVQRLCSMSCGWDDPIPCSLEREWLAWLARADSLGSVCLDRCIGSPAGEVVGRQLHIFSDASETGHSAVAFLRTDVSSDEGREPSIVRFLMGKSLVNPVRFVTVPRLELAAAVVAVKLKVLIERESGLEFDSTFFWTDSMIVLQYIRNTTSRYKTFVANRIGYIHDHSLVRDWRYVPSASNPADVGSRGSGPDGLNMWLRGPDFLAEDEGSWPCEPAGPAELSDDPEVKRSAPVAAVAAVADVSAGESAVGADEREPPSATEVREDQGVACSVSVAAVTGGLTGGSVVSPDKSGQVSATERLLSYFSSWDKLKKAVSWFRKFFVVLGDKSLSRARLLRDKGLRNRSSGVETRLSVSDLRAAENAILRYVQETSFSELSDGCDGSVKVAKSSPLKALNVVRRGGLLVVGGRLSRCPVSHDFKHPVLLPRDHHVTRLAIRDAHERVGHQGREHTLCKVRERFWVIGAGSLVRSLVRSCVICRRVNSLPQKQMMSDLPEDRVTPETPAFECVGLDVFGPVLVKRGRTEVKRYGLMCTCLVTRAVHLEVLQSLRTDSLINAIRRIVARRGAIRKVRSDMGTNMVGADNELRAELARLDSEKIQQFALREGIEWVFNPPSASHFGGAWERQIRTVRKVWRSMPTQRLDDESLHTLFCEIESVINSRPLTYVSSSQGDLEPLTPNHLLLLRGCGEGIPGQFSDADLISVRRWRQVQYLAQQFWLRWRREYLPTLQRRQKWVSKTRNVRQGDVVLMVEDDVPRGHWRLGRVTEVFPGRDGLIRKVLVKTSSTALMRPVHKLIVLLPDDSDVP